HPAAVPRTGNPRPPMRSLVSPCGWSTVLPRYAITDADWDRVKDLLPTAGAQNDPRRFVDAVVYVARTRVPWRDLPDRYGKWNTIWRRFARWDRAGVWQKVFQAFGDPDL